MEELARRASEETENVRKVREVPAVAA